MFLNVLVFLIDYINFTDDGFVDCFKKVLQTEGFKGLYKGIIACNLKVVPSMAIAFMTYERCRVYLKFDPPKK